MAGQVTYQPTEADYVAANRAGFRASLRRWRTLRSWLISIIVCAAIGVFAAYEDEWQDTPWMIASITGWGLIAIPICWGLSYVLIPSRAKRLFRQQKTLHAPFTYGWSDAGLSYQSKAGTGQIDWSDFHGWAHGARTYLFYFNDNLFHFIPMRVMTEDQRADLEAVVTSHGLSKR